MKRKIIFFLVISLFLFSLADLSLAKCTSDDDCQKVSDETERRIKCIEGKCVRTLEITYPKIGEEELTIEKVVKGGIPQYVKYIFTLVIGIIGLVIFGALIYNGFLYLTSVGRPDQMTEAKKGILAVFLGGIILLSAGLIFNTINPQLKILKLEKIQPLELVVIPGVYICNYKVGGQKVKIDGSTTNIEDIGKILETYTDEQDVEKRNEAAKKLNAIMNINNENENVCQKVNASTNLEEPITEEETIFIVPSISTTTEGSRLKKYEYGIILHEKENFRGRADYFPKVDQNGKIYHQIDDYSAKKIDFTARSVTLFKKYTGKNERKNAKVILFEDFYYNATSTIDNNQKEEKYFSITEGKDFQEYKDNDLGKLKNNARSIKFEPKYYLAILCSKKSFERKCFVLNRNQPNLTKFLPISPGCYQSSSSTINNNDCPPLLELMVIIKGFKI